MRLARIALILSAILIGAPLAHAQVAHSNPGCGCSSCQTSCQAGCGCQSCSSCGVLPGLTSKLGHCVGGLLGISKGVDGRHQIYKAALCRNSFDKKFQLPVAYYRHILPFYRHDRCCCGSAMAGQCPTCGPHEGVISEEEVIEVQPVPPAPPEPTPAAFHSRAIVPGAIVPGAVVPPKTSRQDRVATARPVQQSGPVVRQVSATESAPPIRRMANSLR